MSEHPWRRQYPNDGRDFTKIEINIPRELRQWLEQLCGQFKVPPWRLICVALDNEREQPQPFQYDVETPATVYVAHAYNEEAHKIFTFLQKFKDGLGRDVLLLFRHQIGIPNKLNLLLGVRELIEMKLIEESDKFRKRNFLEYPEGYKKLRCIKLPEASPRAVTAQKNKAAKLKSKLERELKKLERMEGNRDETSDKKK